MVDDAARRLRAMALLYAATFLLVGPVAALIVPAERGFLTNPWRWTPSAASIVVALVVAAVSHARRLPPARLLLLGLVFEVAGAYGIAAARYLGGPQAADSVAVSWVAVWMLLFATLVPSPPRQALVAAIAAATAVPAMAVAGQSIEGGAGARELAALGLRLFVPYLLVAALAAIGARIVYRLGTDLTHARELGSYRLVERLGRGGMGEVWRAEHQLLARPAAIKLIRRDGDGAPAEARARFEQEAQVTASLRSPHTIQLYEFGVTDAGEFYYVMELLDGLDLQTFVERFGPLPVDRAVYLLQQVCHSLAEAHERGAIHRDIKPSNVFVCRYGRDCDFVKVLDFGLVKTLDGHQGATAPSLTGVAVARGTPGFMAPEQALGDRRLDARADVYVLGCLAFWLITGTQVFDGATAIDTIVKHVQAAAPAPSSRAPGAVPPAFDALVLACLAKDRDDRPASVDVVASRLRGVPLQQGWAQPDARAWWAAHLPPDRLRSG
jgi:serine/threonine-protein kinase